MFDMTVAQYDNRIMKPSPIARLLMATALCSAGMLSAADRATKPPNIVSFSCDDLGYAGPGGYGHPYAKTPALDRLTEERTLFHQHYVTGVISNLPEAHVFLHKEHGQGWTL
jgi:hypothetical protein